MMADEDKPTWEYLWPVALAIGALLSDGLPAIFAAFVCGMWVAILIAYNWGWRKVE